MSTGVLITSATAADASELAQVMISAYQDDDMYQAAFGRAVERPSNDQEQEERLLQEALFADFAFSSNILLFKAVDPITGRIIGYADRMVPTNSALVKEPEDMNSDHRSTSIEWPSWNNRQLFESGDALLNESRDRLLGGLHREIVWKLRKVVVLPERRGEGVGRQLLEAGFKLIDGEGRNVFPHSTTVAWKLFESSGFEVLEEVEVMEGYHMMAMLRKANGRVS
ncbi:hypothetical protein LTR56_004790 [Elasticomyces elasticus]|nr:hypothetical protein LTR56_004790 [Elasticomyces elasticus]KAK3665646.1 hypothetical protein LTR22_003586 [Elasticomyces elasticus]KAK4930316.1 hypothetical protein LTR49_003057 [Elasticomyces elasticus]KAK5768957.1 hypothetical protein LTS12_001017 [Elasticomyces elasticus]